MRSGGVATRREGSALGEWSYSEWRPPQLAGIVDLIWQFDGPSSHRQKRILPTGRVEVLVNFGDPYRLIAGRGSETLREAWVGGLLCRPLLIEQPLRQNVLGVRMRASSARLVLGTPMHVLEDAVDLRDLLGRASDELAERCFAEPSVEARFALVAAWVRARIAGSRGIDAPIGWSAARIDHLRGMVSIGALRDHTGLSKPRFAASFREQIGVNPKLYARLVRFARATSLLQEGASGLVETALTSGYYDQAHMNADFRELAELSPGEFLAARHPVGDGSTAAEAGTEARREGSRQR
jgi:AraC-like DNA-binding protein